MSGVVREEQRRRVEMDIRQEPFTNVRDTPPVSVEVAMARHRVPGCAVAVIADGELAWTASYGVVGEGETVAVGEDTIFQACSISKPIAAVMALRLVQQGRLDLDEDVNAYLRDWRVPSNGDWQPRITLRQLLSHSAGLTSCWYPGYRRDAPLPTLLQTLRGESPANTPAVFATNLPGVQMRYSGSHYSVVQQLLVEVSGQPFESLAREMIFAPLGMAHSGYETDFPERHGGTTALGHDAGGARIAGDWRVLPESAGAGLWTTPADLARLTVAVTKAWAGQSSALLDRALARQMLTPQVGGRGLGWALAELGPTLRFAHGGSNIGYKCQLLAYPEFGLGAVVMTNADEGSALIREIMEAVAREHDWPDLHTGLLPGQAQALEPAVVSTYAGTYGDAAALSVAIVADGGRLLLTAPGQPPLALRSEGAGRFTAEALNVEVVFEIGTSIKDRSGEVVGLILRQGAEDVRLARVV
jgi:CubicO group peptidase (beta-lactamase class C family)